MPLSFVLQLMGLSQNNENNHIINNTNTNNTNTRCDLSFTIVPNWELVTQRLVTHPEEALVHATNDDTSSPLYIALRNELTPIPAHALRILLLANPAALTDETLDMACRNPCTSSDVMNVLLDARPDYTNSITTAIRRRGGGGYHSWHPPLHIAAKRGKSVEAVRALLERNGGGALWVRDCCCRIPLHEACAEGSPDVLRLILVEGFRCAGDVGGLGTAATTTTSALGAADASIRFGTGAAAGGGLFERDLLGLTPLECAMLKAKHLEDCYAKDIKSGGGGGRRGEESGSAYYHGTDFRDKRRDAWKRLVLCVQAAAAAIRNNGLPIRGSGGCDTVQQVSSCGYNMFDIPFLQAAIEFVVWGGMDLRFNELFHLLLHTGHCDKKAVASTIDTSGRLPFHLAEEQGLTISNGLMQILDAYPEALFRKDIDVRIMPQLIAALGENFGFGMIYTMVTNAPSFFDFHRNQKSILEGRNKNHINDNTRMFGDHKGQEV